MIKWVLILVMSGSNVVAIDGYETKEQCQYAGSNFTYNFTIYDGSLQDQQSGYQRFVCIPKSLGGQVHVR